MITGAWFVLQEISKSSEFAGVGSAVEVGFDYEGLVCYAAISKSFGFADVGCAVEVGFDYRRLVCITVGF